MMVKETDGVPALTELVSDGKTSSKGRSDLTQMRSTGTSQQCIHCKEQNPS